LKTSQFTEEQFVRALRQPEAGTQSIEVRPTLDVNAQTLYRWTWQVAGMGMVAPRWRRQVAEEHRMRKPREIGMSLEKPMLKEGPRTHGCRRPRRVPWGASSRPASGSATSAPVLAVEHAPVTAPEVKRRSTR
jgi:hypothetical protein